ncbi:hypothetical protein EIP91_005367 [Steccherinum ochraceum]|uniref:Uncharacterized protein n=1 Tax=Steccherinum ochraceum TaxID=92696 RepID=A0A4R0RFK6_9APHY|nr:hypothetical protein EIP91_005367 [Steccherinum ochraceum]
MRVSASILIAFLAVVGARPILFPHFVRDDTALDAGSETALSVASDATPSDTSLASATADTSLPSATDSSSSAAPTDSSSDDPSATDADPTDINTTPSVTDTSAADPTDSAADTAAVASVTPAVLSTAVPVSPPACVAKAASLPPPSDTTTADPSTDTSPASADPTDSATADPALSTDIPDSSNATAIASAVFPADTSSATIAASATDSALPATATNGTVVDPSVSVNNTQNVSKRIAQPDLPAVAQAWQDLCLVSGGDIFTNEPCVQLAGINGINALLANADPCAQQDNADAMIDFAKSPGVTNADALIQNAIAFRKHPRNALDILGVIPSTPFCQNAPRNQELVGVVNDQLDGVDPGVFGGPTFGLVAFGDDGTCPFGTTPDVDSCSCVSSSGTPTASDNSTATAN